MAQFEQCGTEVVSLMNTNDDRQKFGQSGWIFSVQLTLSIRKWKNIKHNLKVGILSPEI